MVSTAFSAQAPLFDAQQENNSVLRWMRRQFHAQVDRHLRPGERLLDVNAGTGIDAVYFARRGHHVLAVDNAPGMVEQIRRKAVVKGQTEFITAASASFMELGALPPQEFDHVISNFGGLNCVPDLRPVAEGVRQFLRPGGYVTLAVMPPVCPWELTYFFRGQPAMAFRRLKRNGSVSHIEGHQFLSWYHAPRNVVAAFGDHFTVVEHRGLGSLTPPPYMTDFQKGLPRVVQTLMALDEKVAPFPPFNRCADYVVLTLRHLPR
jgi:ubiquinone/menaquinone biosynthesis C-methylase UbiE